MTIVAGVDIGNSTTEIVIAKGATALAWERRSTRGPKGSLTSIRCACALLANIERQAGVKVDQVIVAPWHPTTTNVATIHEPPPDTGRIQIINCANHSVVGDAWSVGVPWNIASTPVTDVALIAIVEPDTGYKNAAARINEVIDQGISVTGVIVADDEAVLIASRLSRSLPVVDRADVMTALTASRLFIEVRSAGLCVNTATDVWALSSALQTQPEDVESINLITRWVRDSNAVVIGLVDESTAKSPLPIMPSVTTTAGDTVDMIDAIGFMQNQLIGAVCALNLEETIHTSDAWGLDIDRILVDRGIRSTGHLHRMVLASLSKANSQSQISLSELFTAPVTVAQSETQAALMGARTTPGLTKDALILDIGGGTIDLVDENFGISAAGGGELLSAAVAQVLDVPHGAADWIKRGPSQRVESAQVRLSENGSYDFVTDKDLPTPANASAMLVAPGPVGLLAFGHSMQPAEWRIIRQSLKLGVIAGNVSRILQTYANQTASNESFDIVIVGGPAADDELLPVLGQLPQVKGLGRGNVAGQLGHRFAVAYGLTQLV